MSPRRSLSLLVVCAGVHLSACAPKDFEAAIHELGFWDAIFVTGIASLAFGIVLGCLISLWEYVIDPPTLREIPRAALAWLTSSILLALLIAALSFAAGFGRLLYFRYLGFDAWSREDVTFWLGIIATIVGILAGLLTISGHLRREHGGKSDG